MTENTVKQLAFTPASDGATCQKLIDRPKALVDGSGLGIAVPDMKSSAHW